MVIFFGPPVSYLLGFQELVYGPSLLLGGFIEVKFNCYSSFFNRTNSIQEANCNRIVDCGWVFEVLVTS